MQRKASPKLNGLWVNITSELLLLRRRRVPIRCSRRIRQCCQRCRWNRWFPVQLKAQDRDHHCLGFDREHPRCREQEVWQIQQKSPNFANFAKLADSAKTPQSSQKFCPTKSAQVLQTSQIQWGLIQKLQKQTTVAKFAPVVCRTLSTVAGSLQIICLLLTTIVHELSMVVKFCRWFASLSYTPRCWLNGNFDQ